MVIINVSIYLSPTISLSIFLCCCGFQDRYLELQASLTNARLTMHTAHVNDVIYPAYQGWMTSQLERHQFAFRQQRQQMEVLQKVGALRMRQQVQVLK